VVKSTDPDSSAADITLDVRVLGSGYDRGSKATWALNGDTSFATTKIKTNSTRYVSASEIVANITIAADAPQDLFDIVVNTASGKHGIGIELFAVTAPGANGGPWTAVFDDALTNKLRSDDGTAYENGVRCVDSQSFAGGGYQLRSIQNAGVCKAIQRPGWRYFTMDLGAGNTLDLDQDGVAEPIEDAPARIGFPDAFTKGATSTSVRILVLVVNPDGSTTQNNLWVVTYTEEATLTPTPAGGRILTMSTGTADVTYPVTVGKKVVWQYRGTVHLPFQITVDP
jgi:hypothetical protein